MSRPLEGRVALVTGASRGIGAAVARSLSRAGAAVGLLSTGLEGTRALAAELTAQGGEALGLAANLTSVQELDAALGALQRALGPVDILVNNAGIVRRRPLSEMQDADFDEVIAVNLAAPFRLARRLVPAMVERGWGRVVNVSSISGTLGSARMTGYCASKWGLNGLTKALAEEVRGAEVLVAAVLPGSVDTQMLEGSGFPPQMRPEEVARVVTFLCAEAPLAMTGSLVEVFG